MTLPTSGYFTDPARTNGEAKQAQDDTLEVVRGLHALPSGHILVGNTSAVAAAVAMSGDAAISNAGAVTVSKVGGKTITLGGNFTTSGAYALTATLTGPTAVTFPTTGTLATLAGAEEITNKTLNASVGKGAWTTSGTWTLPAFTAGGAITLGGSGNSIDTSGNATVNTLSVTGSVISMKRATSGSVLAIARYWDGVGTAPLTSGAVGDNLVIGNRDGSGSFIFVTAGADRGRVDSAGAWYLGAPAGAESLKVIPAASATRSVTVTGSNGGNPTIGTTGGNIAFDSPIGLKSYTVATLPTVFATGLIYVSNESGGASPAFSNGTNWRRVADNAVVS